jgi:xylulokinase
MRHYLGVDIGTFESKGVLVDEAGQIVASAARAHKMLVPQPGWAEHRAEEDWWGDFTFLSQKLLAESKIDPKSIRAVGASAIGPCMLPVDEDETPLMNAALYGVDTRASAEIEELNAMIGAERVLNECGNALTSQSAGPKMLWLKKNRPDLFANTRMVLTATSFIVHRLTGRYVIDHYSAPNNAPFYNAADMAWSEALAPGVIDLSMLPQICWSTDVVGGVTGEAARQTGLAEGTPVICGTIDAAAEAVSVGAVTPGDMMLMYGSTVFIIALTSSAVRDARLWYAPWLFSGQHASMAGLSTSGTLTHWLRETMARELLPDEAMRLMAAEAESSPPGANGLVMLPYFSGERTPIHDPHAKGVIFGLNLTHQRGDMVRAALEGIAFGTRHVLDTFAEAGVPVENIYAVGGGVKNAVWSQSTSDISGIGQIVCEKTIGASYGDAFLAAVGVGDAKVSDIKSWNPVARQLIPDATASGVYARQYGIFRALYERTHDLMALLDRR